jgi:DMSO/TMAO reductase YedYZ heme-binding membrane subunit
MLSATVGPSPLWYLTRATGAVTLVLLTLTVVLGVSNVTRIKAPGWPRFVVEGVHRNVSLLAITTLAVHIVTSVLDPFGSISLVNALVPFTGTYRPLWLGLGAFASDLLLAIAITSLVRRRLGHGAWRATHWLAYLCWPLAVVHGLGTGSDVKQSWLLALTTVCVVAVAVAIWARVGYGWPAHRGTRIVAVALSLALPVALVAWLQSGPLAPGWAARAGTPLALLAHNTVGGSGSTAVGTGGPLPTTAFTTSIGGSFTESQAPNGLAEVNIAATTANPVLSALDVRIYGTPIAGGGLSMSSSAVSLGSSSDPLRLQGSVTALSGSQIRARVTASDGAVRALDIAVALNPANDSVSGTVTVAPA